MYKDNRYINAGENEIYRYGHKAIDRVKAFLDPNEKGYYSFPVDGGKYWTIGTSNGKFVNALNDMINKMVEINNSRFVEEEEEEE